MKRQIFTAIAAVGVAVAGLTAAHAADTWFEQNLRMEVGTTHNDFVVTPSNRTLLRGMKYRLLISNPSTMTHYLSLAELNDAVRTVDVALSDSSQVMKAPDARTTTNPHSDMVITARPIELRPAETIEWVFTPVRRGDYAFACLIPDHAKAGMHGRFEVL